MGFTNPYPASRLTLDSTASINSGLVAFYPLTDETSSTALDISGNYHNGTMTNGAYFTGSTGIGRCAFFDGSNDYCTTGNAALSIDGSVGSISFWFKSNASQTGARLFEFGSSSSTGRSIGVLITSSGDVTFRYRQSSTNYDVTGPALSSLGSGWNFAVAAWDASNNINLYINGTKYTGTRSGSINVGNLDRGYIAERALTAGSGLPLGNAFQGEMQNVRCWTVELSQAQVDLLYARPWSGTNYGDLWPYSPPAAGSMTVDSSNSLVNGLLLWAPLTEGTGTTADCIVHAGHTGTQSGGVSWASTDIGTVASFDGSDDRFSFNSTTMPSAYPFAVSAWIQTSTTTGVDFRTVAAFGNTSSNTSFAILGVDKNTSRARWTIRAGSTALAIGGSAVNDGKPHLLVGVSASASDHRIYVDGVLIATSTSSIGTNTYNTFNVGALQRSSAIQFFDGNISNVRVYNRDLSATEVATLYHRPWEGIEYGDTFHYDPPAPASMLPLTSDSINTDQVGWWPLTETDDYASGAADISGGGNNGTQSGGVISEVSLLGGVASFDGSNDIIDASAYTIGSAMTMAGWVRYTSTVGSVSVLNICNDGGGTTAQYTRNIAVTSSGNAACNVQSGTVIAQAVGSTVFDIGEWHLVVGTFNKVGTSYDVEVFVDGVSEATASGTGSELTPYTKTCVGGARRYNGAITAVEPCNIQNVRLWDRVLTADEIWSIYANPWLGSNYKLASGSTPLYNYIFRTERFRRLG